MLTALSIRNIVLIEALDLDFSGILAGGLAVLTGETGAGKSILLDALGLVLGARADSGLVRNGSDQASVAASFTENTEIISLLDDAGVVIEPGEAVTLRRTLKADGGSRAFINDQPVSASLLRDVGAALVEIHGQHDDRGLINPAGHRALLDRFASVDTDALAQNWANWQTAKSALQSARDDVEAADRDREWLEHAVAELAGFAPQPGEESDLAGARADMQKGEKIGEDLENVRAAFAGSEGALASLRAAARRLQRIAEGQASLTAALERLDAALIEAGEAEALLEDASIALSFDPARLEAVEARLFDLRALARKHRVQPDALGALYEELAQRLERMSAGHSGLAALEAAEAKAAQAFTSLAAKISAQRKEAAARLDAAVMAELVPLKLDAARFVTALSALPPENWGAHGTDRAEFTIATNPGAPFGGLSKIASGGELSRFILALKVALAQEGGAATLIFDEIDRGVGGAVASAIGDRLAWLASGRQVLVVTHSPQVAARGGQHLFIAKSVDQTVTRTSVRTLSDAERREEIARMLSGAQVTDEARAQADRLLEVV
jgi:DNA repair protein RecN (Recombination protein N)